MPPVDPAVKPQFEAAIRPDGTFEFSASVPQFNFITFLAALLQQMPTILAVIQAIIAATAAPKPPGPQPHA